MYKFRDVAQEHYDSSNKTTLQAYFASYTSIAQSVPSLLGTWGFSLIGHKINIKWRLLIPLVVLVLTYVLFTIFIVIDTDSCK